MCQPCLFGDILGTNVHIIVYQRSIKEQLDSNPNYMFISFIGYKLLMYWLVSA